MNNSIYRKGFARRVQHWFVAENKAFSRRATYTSLCVVVAAFALFSFEFEAKTAPNTAILIAMLLAAVALVILFIVQVGVIKIQSVLEKKSET